MRLLVAAMTTMLALTACGGNDDDGKDDPLDLGIMPACSDVWHVGDQLPEDYAGCEEDDGTVVVLVSVTCTDGTEFTSYDDRLWARLGGTITQRGYQAGYTACVA